MAQQIVTPAEWKIARGELLKEEKAATHLLSDIAAKRRNLPMAKVENPSRFHFTALDGVQKTLLDLFENRRQLILYHFMLADKDKEGCVGCSLCMDHIPNLAHLHSRDTSFVAVATASVDKIAAFKERMGWEFPFFSSKDTFSEADKNQEDITWKPGNGYFGMAVFLRDGTDVFHTYSATDRGVESVLSTYALLDMTALGRQESGNGMNKFRLHDLY